jgi:hypothetical protein
MFLAKLMDLRDLRITVSAQTQEFDGIELFSLIIISTGSTPQAFGAAEHTE